VLSNETVISSVEPFSTTLATNVSLRDAVFTIASNCLASCCAFNKVAESKAASTLSVQLSKEAEDAADKANQ